MYVDMYMSGDMLYINGCRLHQHLVVARDVEEKDNIDYRFNGADKYNFR